MVKILKQKLLFEYSSEWVGVDKPPGLIASKLSQQKLLIKRIYVTV